MALKETTVIKEQVTFGASPDEVYEMLMDSKKHSAFTGGSAKISRKVGGRISAYDGYITGKNLKLIPGKLIEQEWAASDWEKGHTSIVKFELEGKGKKTLLKFTQGNVPPGQYEEIKGGWKEFYWEPMKKMLG